MHSKPCTGYSTHAASRQNEERDKILTLISFNRLHIVHSQALLLMLQYHKKIFDIGAGLSWAEML